MSYGKIILILNLCSLFSAQFGGSLESYTIFPTMFVLIDEPTNMHEDY